MSAADLERPEYEDEVEDEVEVKVIEDTRDAAIVSEPVATRALTRSVSTRGKATKWHRHRRSRMEKYRPGVSSYWAEIKVNPRSVKQRPAQHNLSYEESRIRYEDLKQQGTLTLVNCNEVHPP